MVCPLSGKGLLRILQFEASGGYGTKSMKPFQ